jgi:hypothetical protein
MYLIKLVAQVEPDPLHRTSNRWHYQPTNHPRPQVQHPPQTPEKSEPIAGSTLILRKVKSVFLRIKVLPAINAFFVAASGLRERRRFSR